MYNQIETSNYDGIPIYLYEFRLNDKYWRYCSADQDVSLNNVIWKAVGISDDGVKQTGETEVDAFNITMPTSSEVVGLFIGTPPSNPVFMIGRRYHYGDSDAAIVYAGKVSSINSGDPVKSVVTCVTLTASMERNGLRLAYSRGCPHALYDPRCRVNKEQFRVDATLTTVGGANIVSPTYRNYPDGWFAGGYIEWIDPVRGTEMRAIELHSGDTLTVFGTVSGLAGGMIMKTYPGCARTSEVCITKFNNLANFGGIPAMPDRSPFDGNPLF